MGVGRVVVAYCDLLVVDPVCWEIGLKGLVRLEFRREEWSQWSPKADLGSAPSASS